MEQCRIKTKPNYSRWLFIISHLALGLFNVALFYFYCNADSFVMAFQRKEKGVTYWTLNNFKYFFDSMFDQSSVLFEAFKNTFMWFGVNVFLTVASMFVSYFLYKKVFGHQFFKVAFFLPGLISPIVLAYCIEKMAGTQGFIAQMVQRIQHLDSVPELLVDSRYAIKTLMVKNIIFGLMGNFLIWCGTMSRIPDSVIESAKLDGVNWLQEMFLIVLPCIMPTVAISLCTMLSSVFSANGGEFLYTKGENGTMTFSTWMYLQIYETGIESNSHNVVSAIGWLITIVTVPLVLLTRKISKFIGEVEY